MKCKISVFNLQGTRRTVRSFILVNLVFLSNKAVHLDFTLVRYVLSIVMFLNIAFLYSICIFHTPVLFLIDKLDVRLARECQV